MTHKNFLKALQNLSNNPDKLVDSTKLCQMLLNFTKEELNKIATDLHNIGMIRMYESKKSFQVSLTLQGKDYLEVLEII